jgi:hypothetical protein
VFVLWSDLRCSLVRMLDLGGNEAEWPDGVISCADVNDEQDPKGSACQ